MKLGQKRRGNYVPARGIPFTPTPVNACPVLAPLTGPFPAAPDAGHVCSDMCVGGAVGEGTHGVRSSWRPREAGAGHNAGRLSPGKGKPFAMSHLAIESLLLEARGLLGFEGVHSHLIDRK